MPAVPSYAGVSAVPIQTTPTVTHSEGHLTASLGTCCEMSLTMRSSGLIEECRSRCKRSGGVEEQAFQRSCRGVQEQA